MTKQRDTYFDFLRGIAIIMVIGIHTYVDGLMHFNLFLRQFLNCAVPIFLAIPATLSAASHLKKKVAIYNFLANRYQGYISPCSFGRYLGFYYL